MLETSEPIGETSEPKGEISLIAKSGLIGDKLEVSVNPDEISLLLII